MCEGLGHIGNTHSVLEYHQSICKIVIWKRPIIFKFQFLPQSLLGHPAEMMICRVLHTRESDDMQNTLVKVTIHRKQLKSKVKVMI